MSIEACHELKKVFIAVLEKQAFMFADSINPVEFETKDGNYLSVAMGFGGEFSGRIQLAAPKALAHEVAANFLGVDAESPEALAHGADSLKELLNIICGNLLTALAGDRPVFDLTIPQIMPMTSDEAANLAGKDGMLAFRVEDRDLVLGFELDAPAGTPD